MDHPDIGAYYTIRCGAQTFRSFRKMPRCRAVLSGVHMSRISCLGMPRSPLRGGAIYASWVVDSNLHDPVTRPTRQHRTRRSSPFLFDREISFMIHPVF